MHMSQRWLTHRTKPTIPTQPPEEQAGIPQSEQVASLGKECDAMGRAACPILAGRCHFMQTRGSAPRGASLVIEEGRATSPLAETGAAAKREKNLPFTAITPPPPPYTIWLTEILTTLKVTYWYCQNHILRCSLTICNIYLRILI